MFKLTLFLSLALVVLAKPPTKISMGNNRIVGGQEATPHQFPWQVSLQMKPLFPWGHGSHMCGGTIISKNKVICAAHCVKNQVALTLRVVAGAHDLNDENEGHQKFTIEKMEAHDNFNMQDLADDISMITIKGEFEFNDHVQPLGMFEVDGEGPAVGAKCINSGWGLKDSSDLLPPHKLQFVEEPIVDQSSCQDHFPDAVVGDGMICAGGPNDGPCNGDSGGPLICPDTAKEGEYKLAGIVSFGHIPCGTDEGVFTRVSHYQEWIKERL